MWSLINHLTAPKKFLVLAARLIPWLQLTFLCLVAYGLIGGLILAPADDQQGDAYRIIYIHVPCAFLSLFIYTIMAGAAMSALVWRLKLAFLVLRHSAPLGCSFTLLALLTGSLWGKPMWGTWWLWDARLTAELILFFLYVGILLFQAAAKQKSSAERAGAILVLIGFVDIPIIHYSVYWWHTLHQGATLKLFAPPSIDSTMRYPLYAMIGAFMVYYTLVLFTRMHNELSRQSQPSPTFLRSAG